MKSEIFKDNYYRYVEKDYCVTPLNWKKPFLDKWQLGGFDYEELEKKYPKNNIGLVCGQVSGIIAVDIDLKSDKEINEVLKIIPPSRSRKKGKKGLTLFYRYEGEPSPKLYKDGDTAVELLSDAHQTVLPPSIHDETLKPYVWIGEDLLSLDKEDLPFFDYDNVWPKLMAMFPEGKTKNGNGQFENIKSISGRCPHGSFNRMSTIAGALISKNTSIDEAVATLVEEDKKLHGEIPYFSDPRFGGGTDFANALKMYSGMLSTFHLKQKRAGLEIEMPNQPVKFEIVESVQETQHEIDYKKEKLPKFSGVAQAIFKHIHETSPVPRTRFAVASTLATIGTILGNRVQCDGFHPNIYSLITTHSGGGKDRALRLPYEIFSKANCKDLIGSAPESDSGILVNLEKQTTRLDVFDEASRLFYMMGDTKNLYAGKMADVYATLYTSSGKHFSGKTLKNGQIGSCFSPNVSMLCALTISDFQKSFSTDLLNKGVGGRFLFFPDAEYKDIVDVEQREIPQSILDFCFNMRNTIQRKNVNFGDQNILSLDISPTVKKDRLKIANKYRRIGNETAPELESIYNRSIETLMKLAIIDTVSQGMTEISSQNFDWAVEWFESYISSLSLFLGRNLFSSKQQRIEIGINDFIKSKGPTGATPRDILRSAIAQRNNLQKRELGLYLETSLEKEDIFLEKTSKKNLYFHSIFIKK